MPETARLSPGALRLLLRTLIVAAVAASGGAAAHRWLGLDLTSLVAVASSCAQEPCSTAAALADTASLASPRRDTPAGVGSPAAATAGLLAPPVEDQARVPTALRAGAVELPAAAARAPPALA